MKYLIAGMALSIGFIGCSRSDDVIRFHETAFSPVGSTGALTHEFVYPKPSIRITMEMIKDGNAYWNMELRDEASGDGNSPTVAIWGTGSGTIEVTRASAPYAARVTRPTGDKGYYKIAIEKDGVVIFGFSSEFKDNKAIIEYDG